MEKETLKKVTVKLRTAYIRGLSGKQTEKGLI